MNDSKRTLEINGVKVEVDLRQAVRIDTLKIGDKVRVLDESGYGGANVYNGVVVGFEPFQKLPTIIVAYVAHDYSKAELKFLHWNNKSEKTEIIKAVDDDLDHDKQKILEFFDRERAKKEREIEDLEQRRSYFLDHFKVYWEQIAPQHEPEVSQ